MAVAAFVMMNGENECCIDVPLYLNNYSHIECLYLCIVSRQLHEIYADSVFCVSAVVWS